MGVSTTERILEIKEQNSAEIERSEGGITRSDVENRCILDKKIDLDSVKFNPHGEINRSHFPDTDLKIGEDRPIQVDIDRSPRMQLQKPPENKILKESRNQGEAEKTTTTPSKKMDPITEKKVNGIIGEWGARLPFKEIGSMLPLMANFIENILAGKITLQGATD